MKISLLVLNGVFDSGLSTMVDAFKIASTLAGEVKPNLRFDVQLRSSRAHVTTGNGLGVPVERVTSKLKSDFIIVPALSMILPGPLAAALATAEVGDATDILNGSSRDATIGAACTGTFVLGEAGLLDGYSATTTWWLAPLFRERYPNVDLDTTRIVIPEGKRVTAGAAISHVDLALWIIRQGNAKLADLTARYFLVEQRSSQARFALPERIAHDDAIVAKFEKWAVRHYADAFSLPEVAAELGTSDRTLARRVKTVLERSPLKVVQDVRAQKAIELLADGSRSIDEVASQVGYVNASTLRGVLRKRLGVGLRELRLRS